MMKKDIFVVLICILILCGCGTTYTCARCKEEISEAYYDPFREGTYYCEECAKKYFAPLPYMEYKVEENKSEKLILDENKNERAVKKAEYFRNGEFTGYEIYQYEGKMLSKKIGYTPDGTTISGIREYRYDEKENLISEIIYDANNNVIEKTEYFYLNNGNVRSCRYLYNQLQGANKIEVEKDRNGNVLEQKQYSQDGKMLSDLEYRYEYDESGNVVRFVGYSEDSENEYINTYGIIGKILETNSTDGSFRVVYTYDMNYNLIQKISFMGGYVAVENYYVYSEDGLLIEEKCIIQETNTTVTKYYY